MKRSQLNPGMIVRFSRLNFPEESAKVEIISNDPGSLIRIRFLEVNGKSVKAKEIHTPVRYLSPLK